MRLAADKKERAFPARQWSRRDWVMLGSLTILCCLLFWTCLSVRSLWGPEGRWAMIVREMLKSGNYFVPTVNGLVDLDKPLLTYWVVIPFAKAFGLTEATLRIPSTLAAVALVLLIFAVGRRLFGSAAGMAAALLLLASPMFVFWARTAGAESFNCLAIWSVFWAFLAGARDGKLRHLLFFYVICAVGSFLKGPVVPAVCLFTFGLYSLASALLQTGGKGSRWNTLRESLHAEFRWCCSRSAMIGLLAGVIVFVGLLVAPVIVTGSWVSVSLMWKENIVRFFSPFDHHDPPYVYLIQALIFCAPWSILMVAALWNGRAWSPGRERRWALLSAVGIFLFFTLSGSRRSYYILPLIPALALVTGEGLTAWIKQENNINTRIMYVAATITALLAAGVGVGLVFVHFNLAIYSDASQLYVAFMMISAAVVCLFFFGMKQPRNGFLLLSTAFLLLTFWSFTQGMKLAERARTLHAFADEVTRNLAGIPNDRVFIYQHGTASLLFYLNHWSTIGSLNTIEQIDKCAREHPDGFLIIDLNEAAPPLLRRLHGMHAIAVQDIKTHTEGEHFALLRFGPNQ